MITEAYRRLNADLHAAVPAYGAYGHKWRRRVTQVARNYGCRSVLDYGCGKGSLTVRGVDMRRYDPAVPEHADEPEPADLVVCTDVLEHVEPECLDAALNELRRLTLKAGLFIVATRPSDKTLADGRNAHLIIEPMAWWVERIASRWQVAEAFDSGQPGFWRGRMLKRPPLVPGREFLVVVTPW